MNGLPTRTCGHPRLATALGWRDWIDSPYSGTTVNTVERRDARRSGKGAMRKENAEAANGHRSRGITIHSLVRDGWITNQHGAWAMMLVPLLVGSLLGGPTWWQALLSFAWVVAFFFFNAFSMWVKVMARARARALRAGVGECGID
mgnify:CR=1 FL=1